jgi:hypothetical protein
LILEAFFLAAAIADTATSIGELAQLPRQERVRLLNERSWEMRAFPVHGELEIDGRLDDADWAAAEPVTDFYQRESFEGLPATEPTHVSLLFDEENLYIGFRCFDRDPDRPLARTMFRDENIAADDAVAVMIDAYNDQRSAVFLATNANGILFDMLQNGEESSTRNLNWDTVWYARGSQTAEGWEAEVVVPFQSLRFDPPEDGQEVVFGIGFKRNLPRKNEETYWPFVSNDSTWYRPAELGKLRGLRDIRSGRKLELRPYALGGVDRNEILEHTDTRKEIGIDAKWGVTTSLTADFTVNTDFAQEEADVQQINFTRFSLFFPEKRQIFLESERSFLFGVPRESDLIFTRRIGLSSSGGIIPLLAGARLSGRQGPWTVGIMNIETDDVAEVVVPRENFSVVRLRRDISSRSNVGALFTNREGGGTFNRVFGADLNLYLGKWSLESYLASMDSPENGIGGASSGYAKVEYRADRYGALYRYLDIGESFFPGIGFVRRPDSRQSLAQLRFSPRPDIDRVRQLHFTATLDYVPNQRGVLETRTLSGEYRTTFESGHEVAVVYTDSFEFLEQPFRLRPDVVIEPGGYDFATVEMRFDSFARSHRRLNVSYATGGFWDGERDTLTLGAAYRLNRQVDLSGDYQVNWVDLPASRFTTHLLASRVQIAFRTDLVLMSLFQYNDDTGELSSNVRFNWIPKPGSDFFVVYNELDDVAGLPGRPGSFGARNRSLSVKFNYLFGL